MEAHARGLSGSGNHCAVSWRIHHADKCFREWGPFGLGQWGGRWRCVLHGFALGRWKNACGKAPNNDQRFSHKMPLSRNCAIVSCLFNLGGYGNCEHGYVQDWGGGAHVREGFSPRKDASPCSFVSTQRDGKPRRTYGHAGHASRNRMAHLGATPLRAATAPLHLFGDMYARTWRERAMHKKQGNHRHHKIGCQNAKGETTRPIAAKDGAPAIVIFQQR